MELTWPALRAWAADESLFVCVETAQWDGRLIANDQLHNVSLSTAGADVSIAPSLHGDAHGTASHFVHLASSYQAMWVASRMQLALWMRGPEWGAAQNGYTNTPSTEWLTDAVVRACLPLAVKALQICACRLPTGCWFSEVQWCHKETCCIKIDMIGSRRASKANSACHGLPSDVLPCDLRGESLSITKKETACNACKDNFAKRSMFPSLSEMTFIAKRVFAQEMLNKTPPPSAYSALIKIVRPSSWIAVAVSLDESLSAAQHAHLL